MIFYIFLLVHKYRAESALVKQSVQGYSWFILDSTGDE